MKASTGASPPTARTLLLFGMPAPFGACGVS